MKSTILKIALLSLISFQMNAKEIVIYSVYPQEALDSVINAFTARTGISVKLVEGKSKQLIEQIENEGVNTAADLHLDKDLVFHGLATRKGLYQPFNSKMIEENVPANFIESNKNWVTLFFRSRLIMFNKNTVQLTKIWPIKNGKVVFA